jgi:nucleoside-diphosphate-sugar epimerase
LVTGATGFVGGALVKRLRARGHEVHALVRPGADAGWLTAAGVPAHGGELGDPNAIALAAAGCEVVFHCAGESSRAAAAAALSWINVAGTENVINAARSVGVARVVMLSCADVSLCNRHRLHWKENAVLGHEPLGAFARSKLLAEELALQASDGKLCVTAVRPAYLWGPGDRTNLPELCAEARSGGVRLFGSGSNLFSTTYVDNAADALIAAAHAQGVDGQAFHVADPDFVTAAEFFGRLSSALGLPAPRKGVYAVAYAGAWLRRALGASGPSPDAIARRGRACLLDCLRAVTALDFRPSVTLEQGLSALARWVEDRGGVAAVERLARKPATLADAARYESLANELTGS